MVNVPKIIHADSVNALNIEAYKLILNSGRISKNRNSQTLGDIFVEYDVNCVLTNSRNRHLDLNGRKSNIFALIGESLWVLAGRNDIEYLSKFLPRAKDYSDDGKTWYASYGERMYSNGQLENILHHFKNDGVYTRRATLSIYDQEKDTARGLMKYLGTTKNLDTPCNQWLNFYVTNNNYLNMKVVQRSGDAIWGAMSINLTEFSILHEIVFNIVNEMYPEVKLGSYNHNVTNLHIYENTAEQSRDAVSSTQVFSENDIKIVNPLKLAELQSFFQESTSIIESYDSSYGEIEALFNKYNLPMKNNILYYYIYFSWIYLRSKESGFKNANKNEVEHPIQIEEFLQSNNEYSLSVKNSGFRNFSI